MTQSGICDKIGGKVFRGKCLEGKSNQKGSQSMKKKALFIGGTGVISTAIVKRLAKEEGWEVWLINRGNRKQIVPEGIHQIIADINDEQDVAEKIGDLAFDAVCEFIGFTVIDVERD